MRDTWCGIEQEANDNYDWTHWTRDTPSANTGPSGAQDGYYYIYMEASNHSDNEQAMSVLCPPGGNINVTHLVVVNNK